jgi:hypothetical protein
VPTFFVLEPGSWPDHAQYLCRPLIGTRRGHSPNIPWVTIARGEPYGPIERVRRAGLDGARARALIAEASAFADASRITWNVVETRGLLRKRPAAVRVVIAGDAMGLRTDPMDDLSAEQIVGQRALLDAIGQLDTTRFLAITPKRGWLVLAAGAPGDLLRMERALEMAGGIFGRAVAGDGLSPYAWFVEGGRLTGYCGRDASGVFATHTQPIEAEWDLPADAPPRRADRDGRTDPIGAVLARLDRDRPRHWRDIAMMIGPLDGNLITLLEALAARGLVVQPEPGRWQLTAAGAAARDTPAPTAGHRGHDLGARFQRLVIEVPASTAWQDTDLQPDVLATRPIYATCTAQLAWQAERRGQERIAPVLHVRHVADPSLASRDPRVAYQQAPDDVAVVPSGQEVRLILGAPIRFPATPGRIEVRIAGADGVTALDAVAGTIRFEILTSLAGPGDAPLRGQLDRVALVGVDRFPELPPLPPLAEPLAWHRFA